MEKLFAFFAALMYKSAFLAILGSFIWGILSIILSPCHLSSIPLIIGYVGRHHSRSVKNAFILSLLFGFGINLSILLVGLVTYLTGNLIGNTGILGNIIVSALFIAAGLYFLDILSLDFIGISQKRIEKKSGKAGAFIIGLLFGIGLGPCTFAFMAPVMGLVLGNIYGNALISIGLVLSYSIGHCLLIVICGTATGFAKRIIDFNADSRYALILRKAIGIIVTAAGIYWFYKAF